MNLATEPRTKREKIKTYVDKCDKNCVVWKTLNLEKLKIEKYFKTELKIRNEQYDDLIKPICQCISRAPMIWIILSQFGIFDQWSFSFFKR